ncbi:class F sortase [Actinacidiphila bryophytorum]|uniref:Lipoprotein n=1 Tax=Actinacidiphila bryophytorum TaxID=1436133 RepID=A0A9W4MH64_9ACTN|nr:class F sortase [Actinacidiphila bryophytorum]MBM9435040.1 class F sortase [Actinacidiphila bryophytorum]MBN6544567.1 class F sortase [Actinacidiphila bryophytorum]CAG7642673.1 putative lipoprotein [Actinacidiphila bryophytorum]
MTSLSRRAFATAATAAAAALLAGCGGHQAGNAATVRPRSASPSARPAAKTAKAAKTVQALERSVPVRLQIPAIGVDTPVMQLGLAADGTVEVPPITAHDRAGWYRNSPTPGQTGPSVILAHVTVGRYGDGVFRDLARLRQGDRITARLEDGAVPEFTVTAVRTVAKSDFPTDAVYGDVDRPELRLITCGGPRKGSGYLDNVIVFAALTSTSS